MAQVSLFSDFQEAKVGSYLQLHFLISTDDKTLLD